MKMAPNHGFVMTDASGEPVSRTYQYRKVMKPMLERKRRARINRCLDELKELMTGALQTEGENVAKLEKADILELTVRHLHNLRRQSQITSRAEQSYADRFKAGFRHCAAEVTNFLGGVDHHTSVHVLKHLNLCIKRLEIMPSPTIPQPQQSQPVQQIRQTHKSVPVHQPQTIAAAATQQPISYNQMQPIWSQKSIRPSSVDGISSSVIHRPNYQPVSGYISDGQVVDCCYDGDDDNDDMTRVNTPPMSPKIEVIVDDAPVWRPW